MTKRQFEKRLKLENNVRRFLRKIGFNVPAIDPTLNMDFLLGLDYSEKKSHPSFPVFRIGDMVRNKLSGKIGKVYEIGRQNGIKCVKVRWPGSLNAVYLDNDFDMYLFAKLK